MMEIPFNSPYLTGKEEKYLADVLRRRKPGGGGPYMAKTASLLEDRFSLARVFMTPSCTRALEMAFELIDLKPGEEIILPSYTFPSAANAAVLRGAVPVFAEINRDNFNLDPDDVRERITGKTRAIIPVHYGGVSCEMDEFMALGKRYDLYVIEDAAQGVNARYKGDYLGGIGDFGCYSFHTTKNYISGEGGALVINSPDQRLIEKAEIFREHGTDRARFLRGEVEEYKWVGRGSSCLPSDLQMAVLYAQLEEMDRIRGMRREIFEKYYSGLKEVLDHPLVDSISSVPEDRDVNYHLFYLKFTEQEVRDNVLGRLQERGITAVFHYQPLHSSPMGEKLGYSPGDLKVTEEIAATILRLPLFPDLNSEQVEYIIDNTKEILEKF
ncbi:MAG: dTDP-4-amino-4,6-dideoxygalactose transaminase [Halanaerobiaceae bacterium]